MAKRKALSALRKGDDLDISHKRSKKKRRELHRKLYHALTHKKKKQLTLVQKETRRKMLEESKKILADWEKKFAKSRGKISGSQKAAINKMPLHMQRQVLALSRKYGTLGNKGSKPDPAHVAYNREMIKFKSETEREKRGSRQSKKAREKEIEDQISSARKALGVMKARDEIKKKREASRALVPLPSEPMTREPPTMLKPKDNSSSISRSTLKPRKPKENSSWLMTKGQMDLNYKMKSDENARALLKTRNPLKRALIKYNQKQLDKSYAAAQSIKRRLKEGTLHTMKEESDRETMMNYIKKTSEDSYGCTDHDPKHYNKMAREYVMSKYKDGYLKKEVAMQQMGMIGVPKDEVLKMFGVEKAELDEDVPWKVGRGKSYEHKGKEPKSKRAAKFLKMVKDARLSLKNRPKKEKVDEAHSEKQLRQASDYHRKIAHNIDNVRDREAPGKLKKAWWALKGKDKFIKANNDKYYGQEKQWQYGHQINRHMQAAKTADELLKRKHFEKKGATDVTKLKWNQLGSNYSDRMKESIREGEDRIRPNARDWAIKKAQEKDDEKGIRRHLLGREHTRPSLQRVKPSSDETKAYSIGRVAKVTKHKDGHWLVKSRYNEGRSKDQKHTLKSAMKLARELFYAHREDIESKR